MALHNTAEGESEASSHLRRVTFEAPPEGWGAMRDEEPLRPIAPASKARLVSSRVADLEKQVRAVYEYYNWARKRMQLMYQFDDDFHAAMRIGRESISRVDALERLLTGDDRGKVIKELFDEALLGAERIGEHQALRVEVAAQKCECLVAEAVKRCDDRADKHVRELRSLEANVRSEAKKVESQVSEFAATDQRLSNFMNNRIREVKVAEERVSQMIAEHELKLVAAREELEGLASELYDQTPAQRLDGSEVGLPPYRDEVVITSVEKGAPGVAFSLYAEEIGQLRAELGMLATNLRDLTDYVHANTVRNAGPALELSLIHI